MLLQTAAPSVILRPGMIRRHALQRLLSPIKPVCPKADRIVVSVLDDQQLPYPYEWISPYWIQAQDRQMASPCSKGFRDGHLAPAPYYWQMALAIKLPQERLGYLNTSTFSTRLLLNASRLKPWVSKGIFGLLMPVCPKAFRSSVKRRQYLSNFFLPLC